MIFYEVEYIQAPRIFNAFTVTNPHYYNVVEKRSNVFELAIIREGQAVYQHTDGTIESIGPTQIFPVLPDVECEMFSLNGETQVHDTIQILGDLRFQRRNTEETEDYEAIKDRVSAGRSFLVPRMISLGEKYEVALQISTKIISLSHSPNPSDRLRALCAWYELMGLLTDTVISALEKTHMSIPPSALHYAHGAKAYIAEHYTSPLHVEDIASHLGISPGYLHALFKEVTALSLMDYVNRYRVERACSLLADASLSLGEIGELVGISDAAYMSRLFKKITGLSFTEYKQRKGYALLVTTENE